MTDNIAGKTIVITGASSGMGAAAAGYLAAKGANVVLGARRSDRIEAIAAELNAAGHKVTAVVTDVTSQEDLRRLVDTPVESYGRIDVLTNKAGVMPLSPKPTKERMTTVNLLAAATLTLATIASSPAFSQQGSTMTSSSSVSSDDIRSVSPALARYEKEDVIDGLWSRPQLSVRDRSVVTVAILVASSQTADLPHYMNLALDNDVTPKELSEVITHLAFYAGWTKAMSAVAVAHDIFTERKIGADQLPEASPALMPLNQEGEAARQNAVQGLLGDAAPGLTDFTTDPLFKDVWLRPDLSPRDRSLVTITTLMANGQVAQLAGHLNRAFDNGLTPEQASEVVTQIAFYAGWPNAFSAGPVVTEMLKKRQQ